MRFKRLLSLTTLTLALSSGAWAANTTKVAYNPSEATPSNSAHATSQLSTGALVFSAPPRENAQVAQEIYGPVADYLSQALGRKVVFKHSNNWLTYQTDMQRGAYDLVFDGPHFNAWRATRMQHAPLARLPGDLRFVVAVKKDNDKIQDIKGLNGRGVCAMSTPNLGTLTLLGQFENPSRQPVIMTTEGWDNVYKGLIDGRCQAAVLPQQNLERFDRGNFTRIVYRSKPLPNQAFSAGPRVTAEEQARIIQALTAPEAHTALTRLRDTYAAEGGLVAADKREYAGMAAMLKDIRGYD